MTSRPVILTVKTATPQEDVNIYTDLIAAALHDEGAMVRTGGHNYTVDVVCAPYGRPDTEVTHHASAARGTALADTYRNALLDLGVDDHAQVASMIADLLHYADARGMNRAEVMRQANGYYYDDRARALGIPATEPRQDARTA